MPLSPEEQRQLDEIELALSNDDPTLGRRIGHARTQRRGIVGGVAAVFGSAVLLTGIVAAQAWLGARVGIAFSPVGALIGSVGMLAVAGWFIRQDRFPDPPTADRQAGRPGH